jgi:hypothetical protein
MRKTCKDDKLRRFLGVINLSPKKVLLTPFFCRQTYSLISLWVLTWFSYWIFLKGQGNIINIAGAAMSVTLILASYFVPFPNRFLKATSKVGPLAPELSPLENRKSIKKSKTSPSATEPSCSPAIEKFPSQNSKKQIPQQTTTTEQSKEKTKPQESDVSMPTQSSDASQLADEPQLTCEVEAAPKSKGCPKNLEYYTIKPRPKCPPAECLVCENLIECVCLTSN